MSDYYIVKFDNEAAGPFVAEGANLTWTGGVGFIVSVQDDGLTGTLYVGLVSGVAPSDGDVLTQVGVTADTNTDATIIDYPAYFRNDVTVSGAGPITWSGEALSVSHSFNFDGQGTSAVLGDIVTFSGGQTAELITQTDNGADGSMQVRFISDLDLGLPADNDTFTTAPTGGDGAVNGMIHNRAYSPYELHRLLQDLNDNSDIWGDDDLSRVDYIASGKDTPEIVNLNGTIAINDEISNHMYGGSISQDDGNWVYSGIDIGVTSPNDATQPILIVNDVIVTDYWKNAFMPDSVKGNVRLMVLTKKDGVSFDGQRVKGKLSEFGDIFFIGGTTLGTGITGLSLFSSTDGNNQTAVGVVAGAPYNTVVVTEGFQNIDFGNGNGATPFAISYEFGSANSLQAYERSKYIPRRGTAETLFGRDATYFDGVNRNYLYDNLTGTFSEDEKVFWGTVMEYTGQGTNLTTGEVVTFSGGSRGRLIYQNDGGATGTLIFDMDGNALPLTTETMTGVDSGGDGTLSVVGTNTIAGSGTLIANDTAGTNHYLSLLTGLTPINNSEIYGETSNADCLVNGTPETRTINNQFIGSYTGTNFQTNFGIAIDISDAIVGDIFPNLVGVNQLPPNNQSGTAAGGKSGDTVTIFPWDGVTVDVNGDAEPNYNEMALATAITLASTQIDVGTGNIPTNTPASGWLRVERDSDSNIQLVEYSAHNGDDIFTLVGTSPVVAAIGRTVMRALYDEELAIDGNVGFTSIYSAPDMNVTIKVQNGYTVAKNGPIKPSVTTAVFGSTGFLSGLTRTSDA